MNSRRLLWTGLIALAGLFAVSWLRAARDATPSRVEPDPVVAAAPIGDVPSEPIAPRETAETLKAGLTAAGDTASSLAARMDDLAVRLRSNRDGTLDGRIVTARRALQAGRLAAALEMFDDALAKAPRDPAALAGRAEALARSQRYKDAEQCYARLLEVVPSDVNARYDYACLLCRLERWTEAAEHFRAVVRLDPNHARGHFNLGVLADRDGRLQEAVEAWTGFTRLAPNVFEGWLRLGLAQMDLRRPAQAAECFTRAIALDGSNPDGYAELAQAHAALGEIDAALAVLRVAEQVAPCDEVIAKASADLLALQAGEPADALEAQVRALADYAGNAPPERPATVFGRRSIGGRFDPEGP